MQVAPADAEEQAELMLEYQVQVSRSEWWRRWEEAEEDELLWREGDEVL